MQVCRAAPKRVADIVARANDERKENNAKCELAFPQRRALQQIVDKPPREYESYPDADGGT